MPVDVRSREQLWKTLSGDKMEPVEKAAELTNTYDMPWSPAPSNKNKSRLKTVNKTASVHASTVDQMDELLKQAFTAAPDDNEAQVLEEAPDHIPQNTLKSRVDVSGKEPPKAVKQKTAQHYALPSREMYPLDGYDQVEKAASYFDEYGKRMEPVMRREFCQNLVKRASALGIPVSKTAASYGSETWASPETLEFAMFARKSALTDEDTKSMYDKLASARGKYIHDPELFAETLGELDKVAGLDIHYGGDVPDPYISVFEKSAETVTHDMDADPDKSYIEGNEYLTEARLVEFATRGNKQIEQRFGDEIAAALAKDPDGIFNSLPRDQKIVLMRMANNSDSLQQGASTS